ncbi:class I SAM-dependent methyltransferase [Kordiimonas aquimaris]|uniref:class I SAM-dependent methyltransferase n=1 Tax=Kordiimonas aquimaris TaxID=707591 RepID=UPI0021D11E5D|nr:class I SAM-dependent methyltransferase [Kordiimonas aquimaris]
MQQREWHSPLYGEHVGAVLDQHDEIEIVACKNCGFAHVIPIPAAEAVEAFYQEDFYQTEKSRYLEEAREDFEWKATEFNLRVKIANSLLGRGAGRVLDIGCGPGDFLKVAQDAGWDAVGIEPSPIAAKYAKERGLNVINGFFDAEASTKLGQFDFIHLSEVLEHIAEPIKLITLAEKLLNPGGVLCVSVPNDYNALQLAAVQNSGKKKWWIVPDHHLNYFNFDSLASTIEQCGLTVRQRLTNFPMELFLLMGQDYTKDPKLGRELHGLRKNLDINLATVDVDVMLKFYESLAQANMGRLAIVFATKPYPMKGAEL